MRILYHARIRTLDPNQPFASAIAINQGHIVAIGADEEILALATRGSEKENMQGKTIWPGLTDAHIHLEQFALSLSLINCETFSRAECIERIAARAQRVPPGQWIRGHGWNQNMWTEGFGNAGLLDQAAPDNPVYLTAKSLHAGWANSLALRLAGITKETPDPQDGKIVRDERGEPTGILLEGAVKLVENVITEISIAQLTNQVEEAQHELLKLGITGIHDFDSHRCFMALQKLQEQNRLRMRVIKNLPLENLQHAIALGLRTGFGNDFLRIGAIKLFADGALGPQSAAMFHPYENSERNNGMLFLDRQQIFNYGKQAAANGLGLAIHAIGDRANHEAINGLQLVREYEQTHQLPALRHRIEHVQVLHPDDFGRLAQQKIIASMQPIHATSDMATADYYWGNRTAYAYAWKSLIQKGTVLAFGSDAPVENPNPFWGLHAAVTRQQANEPAQSKGWHPEQCLSLQEALEAYTLGPAFASGLEHKQGQLSPGFYADLIVLSRDPFECPLEEIHNICPCATMISGEWVWTNGETHNG